MASIGSRWCVGAVCGLWLALTPASAMTRNILFEGDSIYNHITITDDGLQRCMVFGRLRNLSQTCIQLAEPDAPLFEYTEMLFAGFLFQPESKRIALLGLGGGYVPLAFRAHLPQIQLDVVEVDPLVTRLAGEFFDFKAAGNIASHVVDGRQFLQKRETRYDHIWIDVFNSDYIPSHMTTKEFLQLAQSRLNEGGVVVQNCFGDNRLFDAQLATFRAVFRNVYVFRGERTLNAVIIGTDGPTLLPAAMEQQAARFGGHIGKVDLQRQIERFEASTVVAKSRILTDDYAPANLWIHRKRGE